MTAVMVGFMVAVEGFWLRHGDLAWRQTAVSTLVLTTLFALANGFVVMLPVRRGAHALSFSEIPLVLGMVMLHPALLLAASVSGAALGMGLLRHQRGSKLLFNVALAGIETTTASAVFTLAVHGRNQLGPRDWIATYVAVFIADLVSIVLVTSAITLHDDKQEWHRLFNADVRSLFQAPLIFVTTTLALVSALVVRDHPLAAVLLAVLAYAAFLAFRGYARQTQGHEQVEQLYSFTRTLSNLSDSDEVTRTVLNRVRDLVRASSAELVVLDSSLQVTTRVRLSGQDHIEVRTGQQPTDGWWHPAASGTAVLHHATIQGYATALSAGPAVPERPPPDAPDPVAQRLQAGASDAGMAVPVALDQDTGVLSVNGCLVNTDTFTMDHLRLMEALAAHAGVALTNTHLVDRLRYLSLHDALTGLPNRHQFHDLIRAAVDAQRDRNHHDDIVAILVMDLDRFKEVNDALGHAIGDDLLREVGRRLRDSVADNGTVARLGGDEFAVLYPHLEGSGQALDMAGELLRAIELPLPVGDLELTTQASIGICFAPHHGHKVDRLLRRADVAMYAAKNSRSGVHVYRPDDDQNTPRRLALMTELRTAVNDRILAVAFQPKVDVRTGRATGAEALVRWQRPEGPITPDEFIPLAERSGLIRPLTEHVLDTAIRRCAEWHRAHQYLHVAVNLSPQILSDTALVDVVAEALERHTMPASALTLEITENGTMEDPVRCLATLEGLRDLGTMISIDDFGTGHSSLGRLAELPIQEIKIDKGFVHGLKEDIHRRAVTDAAIQLGRTLDLIVVAEGVEEVGEYEYLREQGCDLVQGYLVSKPLPGPEFLDFLLAHPEGFGVAQYAPKPERTRRADVNQPKSTRLPS